VPVELAVRETLGLGTGLRVGVVVGQAVAAGSAVGEAVGSPAGEAVATPVGVSTAAIGEPGPGVGLVELPRSRPPAIAAHRTTSTATIPNPMRTLWRRRRKLAGAAVDAM
jgi:hypothetical protein